MYITNHPIPMATFLGAPPAPACGAVASFVGFVRDHHEGRGVEKIFYECYDAMAERQIDKIVRETKTKYPIHEIRVLHRVGWLVVGDASIAIAASAAHRGDAFAACRDVIERIKREVPVWKKEYYTDGTVDWVLCTHPPSRSRT